MYQRTASKSLVCPEHASVSAHHPRNFTGGLNAIALEGGPTASLPQAQLVETRLSSAVIVMPGGKPCPEQDGFLVSATALTNPAGFSGRDGVFRLLPNGHSDYALVMKKVAAGGAVVVDGPKL